MIHFVPRNIYIKYECVAGLLHNSLVAMVTVFPYQQGKPVIPILLTKVCAKLELHMSS